VFDNSLHDAVQRRAMIEQALREPGLISQLSIIFQPQVDLRSNRISGAEILVRWTHPEHGPISPAEFIPITEQLGMIIPIGTWVLREACRQAAHWRAAGLPALTISVNVSSVQFRIGNIPDLVAGILAESGLPGDCLELEITETAVMNHTADSIGDLHALSALGVGLAIDDFGTGYSSLSYLRQLPVNRIKIDQSFIRDAIISEDASMIARTIVQLAHSLRLDVVAEGVETTSQLEFVRATGCRFAQGYYYSPPVDAARFSKLASRPLTIQAVP
jgi:EAL domain-containing protein (putative c-di-GMP-specific phosphodiesterase class I)